MKNINTNLNLELANIEDVLWNRNNSKYNYIENLLIDKKNIEKAFELIKQKYKENFTFYENKDFLRIEDKESQFSLHFFKIDEINQFLILTQTLSQLKEFVDFFKELIHKSADYEEIEYHKMWLDATGKLKTNTKFLTKDIFDGIKDYYPLLDTNVLLNDFFTSDENILLLLGEPGVGKSKFITFILKSILSDQDLYKKILNNNKAIDGLESGLVNILDVKDYKVLIDSSFWGNLEDSSYHIILLDDMDHLLGTRKKDQEIQSQLDIDSNNFINQFLTFSDGILKNNVKFIITTNNAPKEIDKALLREGRMFDILQYRALYLEEVEEVFKGLEFDFSLFKEKFPDTKEITISKLAKFIKNLEEEEKIDKKLSKNSYLKSDISLLKEYNGKNNKKKNKIGF